MTKKNDLPERDQNNSGMGGRVMKLAPAVDIYENEEEILLHADLPGVARTDISIEIDDGKLSVSGQRKLTGNGALISSEFTSAEFTRTFSISKEIDVEKINATLELGVLKLHLPKSASARPRKIEIQSASNSVH
ncbi:MAG: Hsp20/alpha crystallin family protein [Thermodesulfobacteriota bacterium]